MSATEEAAQLLAGLSNPLEYEQWQSDPIRYVQTHGFELSDVEPEHLASYRAVLQAIDVPNLVDSADTSLVAAAPTPLGCGACEVGIGATVTGIAAVVIAALVASDGAAAAVEPVIEGAAGAVIAAETGLSIGEIAAIFAKAFASAAGIGFVGVAIRMLCVGAHACR